MGLSSNPNYRLGSTVFREKVPNFVGTAIGIYLEN
jgi:hypothetical protein